MDTLATTLKTIAQETLGEMDLRPTQRVDVDNVRLPDLDRELADYLRKLEPCGFGNPTPVLASRGLKVANSRSVGAEGKHLKLSLTDGRLTFDAIAFGQAPAHAPIPPYVDVAYSLEWNEWNGERRLQLNIKNMQKSS
ncbi:MAG: hypothetical protein IT318_09745 [Anaerolineales bacterium]|nr:hypothetical protein [Anaerolineales bacterium]